MKKYLYEIFGYDLNLIVLPATARYEAQVQAGLSPKMVYEINQHGHGVIIGGGNLYENNELDINIDALNKLEVPLMLFSLSRGRIYNRWGEMVDRTDTMPDRTLIALNNKTKHAYARDQATLNYLHGIGCTHVKLSACPSIFIDGMLEHLPVLPETYRNRVLISIRNPSLMSIPPINQVKVHRDIEEMVLFLRSEGYEEIFLVCHDQRDITYASTFTDLKYIFTNDLTTYLAMLKICKLHITYRLHSFLPCLAWNVPAIKISYDERALSLIETVGFGEWNINMLSEIDLVEAIKDRHTRLSELKTIKNKNTKLWSQIDSSITLAFKEFYDDVTKRKV